MEELVTIKTYIYPYSLAIVKSLLDEEDIFYTVKDELIVQTHPFYSNAVGGIKLQVRASDAERVTTLLKDSQLWDSNEILPLSTPVSRMMKKYILLVLFLIVIFLIFIIEL